ncbi:MAG: ankyrin repeat domain-containing protein [Janthinobacterium lividum]
MKRLPWLLPVFLLGAGCGDGRSTPVLLTTLMRSTYPATKYFAGTPLLPLAQLIENDDPALLARRLDEAAPALRRAVGHEGMTLVLYAMMNRRKACLTALLTHGADPNQNTQLGKNKLQVQPVAVAAGGEDPELLIILLDHKGDPNSRYDDEPALFSAIQGDHYDHVRLLLDRGADINATDKDGDTAMQRMAYTADFEQVAYLIRRGADVHKPDNQGATLAFSVQTRYVSPTLPAYKWQQTVKQMLIDRGVKFPVPHPGIAFQAKVRQENAQRRRWEATPEGEQWLARIAAAESNPGAGSDFMTLRFEAEQACQAWRKNQPDWFPTTNAGRDVLPIYNHPPTLEREAAEVREEEAALQQEKAAAAARSDSALKEDLLHRPLR